MRVIWGVPDTPQARKTGSRINYWLPAVFILFKLDSYSFICYSSHYPSHISEKFCKLKEGTVYSNLSDVASDCFILYLLLS